MDLLEQTLTVILGYQSHHKQNLPKVLLLFFLKLTYKQAMCPFLAQLAGRTLRMTFVIWCNAILFIHPIPVRFGVSASLSTPETILCLRLSDTAGCSGGNAAEKR